MPANLINVIDADNKIVIASFNCFVSFYLFFIIQKALLRPIEFFFIILSNATSTQGLIFDNE